MVSSLHPKPPSKAKGEHGGSRTFREGSSFHTQRRAHYSSVLPDSSRYSGVDAQKNEDFNHALAVQVARGPSSDRSHLNVAQRPHAAKFGGSSADVTFSKAEAVRRLNVMDEKAASMDPKVYVPFDFVEGQIPRQIEIERRKRGYHAKFLSRYADGIDLSLDEDEEQLQSLDVDDQFGLASSMGGQESKHFLPLALFDAADFDVRTGADWIKLGLRPDGSTRLPCRTYDHDLAAILLKKKAAAALQEGKEIVAMTKAHAAVVIQCTYRQYLAKKEVARRKAELRRLNLEKRLSAMEVRKKKRQQRGKEDNSARVIQRYYRKHALTQRYGRPTASELKAATKIQAAYRGFNTRQHQHRHGPPSLTSHGSEGGLEVDLDEAARKIQIAFKQHRQLQATLQATKEREEREEREAAAKKIQSAYRSHQVSGGTKKPHPPSKEQRAARRIQAQFRGHKVREMYGAELGKMKTGGAGGHPSPWREGEVIAYRESDNKYCIRDGVSGKESWKDRIDFMFMAEDPDQFALRVRSAHAFRNVVERRLKMVNFVQNMPLDDVSGVTKQMRERIFALVVRKSTRGHIDKARLKKELLMYQQHYSSVMNSLAFCHDVAYRIPFDLWEVPATVKWPARPQLAPYVQVEDVERRVRFAEARKDFEFYSLLTFKEAHAALLFVSSENLRLRSALYFNCQATKSVQLEEFEQNQSLALGQFVTFLRDSWMTTIRTSVRSSFGDVGKGWFTLGETNREIYNVSKLRRLMIVVNCMMESTLRVVAMSNMERFVQYFENVVPLSFHAGSPSIVRLSRAQEARRPIFALQLCIQQGRLSWNTPLESFVNQVTGTWERGLQMMSSQPQVEPYVVDRLFWAHHPSMKPFHPRERVIKRLFARLQDALRRGTRAPIDYMMLFREHDEIISLDPQQMLQDVLGRKPDLAELTKEATFYRNEYARYDALLVNRIDVGLFLIDCQPLKQHVLQVLSRMCTLLLEAVSVRLRELCLVVTQDVAAAQRTAIKRPQGIEDVVSTEEFIAGVSDSNLGVRKTINDAKKHYQVLEEFRYPLGPDVMHNFWTAVGSPLSLERECEKVLSSLAKDRVRFESEMDDGKEKLYQKIADFTYSIETFSKHQDMSKHVEIFAEVKRVQSQLRDMQMKAAKINSREPMFGRSKSDFTAVAVLTKDFEPYSLLWSTTHEWLSSSDTWMNGDFNDLDPDYVETTVQNAVRSLNKCSKRFKDNQGCWEISQEIRRRVDAFRPHVPLIQALRNPGLRNRHWTELQQLTGMDCEPKKGTALNDLLDMRLDEHLKDLAAVSDVAGKEYSIEQALERMRDEWLGLSFEIVPYRDTATYIMRGSDEIAQLLDDHIVMTQSMSFSPYKKPFEEEISKWETRLHLVQDIMDEWLACQRQWLYLQPIFSSDDINRQMPAEAKRYATMDRMWRHVMGNAFDNPKVFSVCDIKNVYQTFQECNRLLDNVQKGLSDYLETKRSAFPRFYFLSNDELLEILSQTREPRAVQPHLRKCFENIASLEFQANNAMTAMHSAEGESVPFVEEVMAVGNVEHWLLEVERVMRTSVKAITKAALGDYQPGDREAWVLHWPCQAILAASQIHWTSAVSAAIVEHKLPDQLALQLGQLEALTTIVRGELTPMQRATIGSLLVVEVHARDVLYRLEEKKVASLADFDWIVQLRSYWEDEEMLVRMVTACLASAWEYLGNTSRLVITPLTDRCYLTLLGALQLNLGGAPQGPAGTGKTETTKDLAKVVAKQCVVFNCSDGLDYLAMAKFFKGLASAGAWACFDEFNRIDLEVLSVIAQQIQTLNAAVSAGEVRLIFEGTDILLNPGFAVFITMNPGYAGRSELPDNLKALFRPVAMMIPDYAMIGEIMLFSFGFREAKSLSTKMVVTFRLSSEQLSSQDHYDFGMRAVKTVISAAGNLKRAAPNVREELHLLKALKDVNVPKFTSDDMILFEGILSDLFPGVELSHTPEPSLVRALEEQCEKHGLQSVPAFVEKCLQLYDSTVVRHGLMLVGPSGGGKTAVYRTLGRALSQVAGRTKEKLTRARSRAKELGEELVMDESMICPYQAVLTQVMNPKAVTMGQLYGQFDENTHEWTDGILARLVRECASQTSPDLKWVVFDGPVDAIWIENMNTVLDDNKKLCLVSGEIISLTPSMTILFEVEDLAVASPATVSRCGMIYLAHETVGIQALVDSWLQVGISENWTEFKSQIAGLIDQFLASAVHYLYSSCLSAVSTESQGVVAAFLRVLGALLENAPLPAAFGAEMGEEEGEEQQGSASLTVTAPKFIDALVIFSIVWSVGALCDGPSRALFDKYLRGEMAAAGLEIAVPDLGLLYDYLFELSSGKWISWYNTREEYVVDIKQPYSTQIVPTIDTIRSTYILKTLLAAHVNILCVGETGTGKSVTVRDIMMNQMDSNFAPLILNFSAQTHCNQVQDQIDGKLEKKRKGVFGPPLGKQFILFVDDLNMPQREKYGAQPPIELLRQWFDHGGWYDRKTLLFREICNVQMIAAMGPPGGGRNHVTARFLSHFNVISFPVMEHESMRKIFGTLLAAYVHGVKPALEGVCTTMVDATLFLYRKVTGELRPTPSKSHYTFNLRDVSKVVQGILAADLKKVEGTEAFVRLWCHESARVFADRLINDHDRHLFQTLLQETMKDKYDMELPTAMEGRPFLIYGDFLVPSALPKLYVELNDTARLQGVVEEYLEDYNSQTNQPMALVMFMDAIGHLARISRVIRLPQGNALLLGVGGSGRQSLTRLAAFMAEFELFQIELTKGYGKVEWREDVKRVLLRAGLDGITTVFLMSDTQVVDPSFMEDINSMLSSGDIPNLWGLDDFETIYQKMRPLAQQEDKPTTKHALFQMFVDRIIANVRIVLCMSPLGELFRSNLRMFPALVNNCTIDWFSEWPADALSGVAARALADLDLGGATAMSSAVAEMCVYMHQSVARKSLDYVQELGRHNYVTPTSYLELLSVFQQQLQKTREVISLKRGRLQLGLDKLQRTAQEVEVMQEELTALQPVLLQTQDEVDSMMFEIEHDKADAAETRLVVLKEENEAAKQASDTQAIADDAKADLDEALPALDAAVASLKSLNKNDIVEVRTMQRPPSGVKLVMEAVGIMKGLKPKRVDNPNKPGSKMDDYWDVTKGELVDPGRFLESLFKYDKENIPEATIRAIEPYIQNEDFLPSAVSKVSKACTSLCLWVRAMYKYYHVAIGVAPKRERLKLAQESLEVTMTALAEAKKKLSDVEEAIRRLEAKYDETVGRKNELKRKVEDCEVKLQRAHKLIGGLGGEKDRWTQDVTLLDAKLLHVVGDVLLCSGFISYLAPFTASYRAALLVEWRGKLGGLAIPFSPNATLVSVLGDAVAIRQWHIFGLPRDPLSIENGIVMKNARRWPLCVDPQGQANKWIRNFEKHAALDCLKQSDKDFLRTLENAIRFGKPVLLENVGEELEPALEPVLLKQTFKQGGTEMIKLGDNIIPYHADFRFYMTSKLPNPHYRPEVSVKVTVLNFTLTPEGLEDQLLALVVMKERSDLEEAKGELVLSGARMQQEIKEIEDKILHLLSVAEGDILDDEVLIDTLDVSKQKSEEIKRKVDEADITEKEIDDTRSKYRPVAYRAALLFFAITDLAVVDPMYQYSLTYFVQLFDKSILDAPQSPDLKVRLQSLVSFFTFALFSAVSRSLFEKHKLIFAFLLTARILVGEEKAQASQYKYLLTGGATLALGDALSCPEALRGHLTDSMWNQLVQLEKMFVDVYDGLCESLEKNPARVQAYLEAENPLQVSMPAPLHNLGPFHALLPLRVLRSDFIGEGVRACVAHYLGKRFVEPPAFDLLATFAGASATTPIIFVLSAGADPGSELLRFADQMRFSRKLTSVSLGQGQGPVAERMLREGMGRGLWVLLQNCHLAVSWLPKLEAMVESLGTEDVHEDFRLWLTSMPTPQFPVTTLQNSLKVTNEPPRGLRANLARSYAGIRAETMDHPTKRNEFKQLLYALCFFHGVVLERRSFGALGWNIAYDFTQGDLDVCIRQLNMFLSMYEEIPFEMLRYLAGEINYGGRVTDDWDRRSLKCILARIYGPKSMQKGFLPSENVPAAYLFPAPLAHVEYLQYIGQLPLSDSSEIFGLHANATIKSAQDEGNALLAVLLKIQPSDPGSKQGSGGDSTGGAPPPLIHAVKDILATLPKLLDVAGVCKKRPPSYQDSMATVFIQEYFRYNRLLTAIQSTLQNLLAALDGLVVLSADLEDVGRSVELGLVPMAWSRVGYPSEKLLGAWYKDLIQRVSFMEAYDHSGVPAVFWISGFFFPQAFLTGALQNYARKARAAIDTITFTFTVMDNAAKDFTQGPVDGVYIDGLFLEGCQWNSSRGVLVESESRILFTPFPVMWLRPVVNAPPSQESTTYTCPVYKTTGRAGTLSTTGHSTNYVLSVEIPTHESEDHWVRRGVALICSLSY